LHFVSINTSFSPASLRIRKWRNSRATRTDHFRVDDGCLIGEKIDVPTVHIRDLAQRSATSTETGYIIYVFARRENPRRQVGRDISLGRRRHKSDPISLFLTLFRADHFPASGLCSPARGSPPSRRPRKSYTRY